MQICYESLSDSLPEYYFDIETYSPNEKPDPLLDKIITIQYQELRTETGEPKGDLKILTEWDFGSEEKMLDEFRKVFITSSDFGFIPIGMNLYGYDLIAVINKLNHYFDLKLGLEFYRNKPVIDIKPTLVMMNGGRLRGYSDILGKTVSGSMVREWYKQNDRDSILKYIKDEAEIFITKYQILKREIPKIRFS